MPSDALPRDPFEAVMLIECGEPSEAEYISAFQTLIDCGLAWQLQGWYGRTAQSLIAEGLCTNNNGS